MKGLFRLPAVFALVTAATAARADDWPQWMGPQRDGVWRETGIVAGFPADGLKPLWTAPVQAGYAGPAVADGRVYVTDFARADGGSDPVGSPAKRTVVAGKERVLCLDAKTGGQLWKHEYPCQYEVSYPGGPRCTPTVAQGKVYTLGAMGDLLCLDAVTGKPVWVKNLPKDYGAKVPLWGFCGHPLVFGHLLVCPVGGKAGLVVAFDTQTGKKVWSALPEGEPGYCPPTLIDAGGSPELVLATPTAVVALDPATGVKRWEVEFKPHYAMAIAAPQQAGDLLFAGAYGDAVVVKLGAGGTSVAEVWRGKRTTGVYPSNSTPLVADGVVYGVDVGGQLRAVQLGTGERLWETTEPVTGRPNAPAMHGTAFLVRNEDRYFLFNELGELIVARLTPEGYTELGRAKLVEPTGHAFGRKVVWSHPAFANKCVYARNDHEIACFSLAAK